jgi:LEA14-like dessication related protein
MLAVALGLGACASNAGLVAGPDVRLKRVEVAEIEFSRQVFVLGLEISNPNPFALPVTGIRYGIDLDGSRFATGETGGGFAVPAHGAADFAIRVELDLLKSAPQLLNTVRNAARSEIHYDLAGSLVVDLPFTKPLKFANAGDIRLRTL